MRFDRSGRLDRRAAVNRTPHALHTKGPDRPSGHGPAECVDSRGAPTMRAAGSVQAMPAVLVSLIAAVARNRVIGVGNRLPWHLPADLRRFRALTWGKAVVMGRRTHESIGRPLPGRRNIVITRAGPVMAGCERARSLEDALALAAPAPETVVIGGARCYREALPLCRRMYLTRLDADFSGDAWFPEWEPDEWVERARECVAPGETAPFGYAFLVLERHATERTSPV